MMNANNNKAYVNIIRILRLIENKELFNTIDNLVLKKKFINTKNISIYLDKKKSIEFNLFNIEKNIKKSKIISNEMVYFNFLQEADSKFYTNKINEIKLSILNKVIDLNSNYTEYNLVIVSAFIDNFIESIINKNISIKYYFNIMNKLIDITEENINIIIKILNKTNYLLLHKDFSGNYDLREYKAALKSLLENKNYEILDFDEIINKITDILANNNLNKDDFNYIFSILKIHTINNNQNLSQVIDICYYFISSENKKELIKYRFIKKIYIDFITFLILHFHQKNNHIKLLNLLIKIYNIDEFNSGFNQNIFDYIIIMLNRYNNKKNKLDNLYYYKYCEIINLMILNNPKLNIDNLSKIKETLPINKQNIFNI